MRGDDDVRSSPVAIAALVAGNAATPAKMVRVSLPGVVFRADDTKVCLPRKTSPVVGKDKSLPQTLCQTRAAWAAHGVEIVTK